MFRDINLAIECENNCATDLIGCVEDCDGVTECTSSCYRGNVACIDACPCHAGKCHYITYYYISYKNS